MCPDKKRPAENTCRIVKGLDAVWAHFCPSKPCLPLSIDGRNTIAILYHKSGSLSHLFAKFPLLVCPGQKKESPAGLSFFDVRMSYLAARALLASAISWKMPACFLLTIALMTSRVATIRMQAMIRQMTTFWIRPARMKLTKVTPETVRA